MPQNVDDGNPVQNHHLPAHFRLEQAVELLLYGQRRVQLAVVGRYVGIVSTGMNKWEG